MEKHTDDSDPIPEDATEATEYQREEQELLDHQNEDSQAPGVQQSRDDIADESSR
ncbi:hypothetical protein [Mycobacterium paraterrae]|uniref:Uncharacterized protein n=1 Tax=Mycobacterium paraterrae TaxID=577492 RepID=A0ABY3VM64_9MYCO|nr:hypothetical protein [Mycobacterium paraterrae]UMB70530.1 hypothetical protein MKK62_04180 [Mycobacterium paraterrae]